MQEEISFKLGLDAKSFQRGLTSVRSQVVDAGASIKNRLLGAFTVTAALAGLKALGERVTALKRQAEDFGTSAEFLQSIGRQAVRFGGQAEDANRALAKLLETIGQARTEGGAAAEKFARFGIALYDANGNARNTEEIFKAVADAYRNSSDASTKAALALEFFGKTGRDINNILGEGADGIDAYTEKLKEAGQVMSDRQVAAVAASWREIGEFVEGASGKVERFVGKVALGLTTVAKLGAAFASTGGRGWREDFSRRMQSLKAPAVETGTRQVDESQRILALEKDREKILRASLADEQKITTLASDQRRLFAEMAGLARGSVAWREKELKLLESQAESRRVSEQVERRQLDMAKERAALEKERAGIIGDVNAKRVEKLLFTRDELKSLNPDDIIPQNRKLFTAQQKQIGNIETLEGFGRDARSKGNLEYARRIDLLVESLLRRVTLLKPDERLPFREQERRLAELNAQLGPAQAMPALAPGALPRVPAVQVGGLGGIIPAQNPLAAQLDALTRDVKTLRELAQGAGLNMKPRMGR